MIDIMAYLIVAIVVVVFIKNIYKEYKKTETIDEKTIIILIVLIVTIPMIFFYLDYLNIATIFKWIQNENGGNRWFQFLTTYCSTIIGALIGAIALIIMTSKQIDLEREKNAIDRRLLNMPILNYYITSKRQEDYYIEYMWNNDIVKQKNLEVYNLFLKIDNVGLNHARHLKINVNILEADYHKIIDFSNTKPILKTEENIKIDMVFNFKYTETKNNDRVIKLVVEYDDIIGNSYEQEIEINTTITNKSGSQYAGYYLAINNINILDEKIKNK